MKVIDSFTFFNEIELLKLRLNYLNDVVDYFIISESNYTHSGKSKPYYLDEILNELPKNILRKIVRLKYEPDITAFNFETNINFYDLENDHWRLEKRQRDLITQSLSNFSSNDIFMLSDLDEIPNKKVIEEYKEVFNEYKNSENIKTFCSVLKCIFFYYNFNTVGGNDWNGTVICTVENAIQMTCDYLRYHRNNFFPIQNGGWHFSTLGSVDRIKTKIQSFAHQEYNNEIFINDLNITNSIKNKKDIYHNNTESFKEYNFLDFPEDLRNQIIKIFSKEFYTI